MIVRTTKKSKTISIVFIDEIPWGILGNRILLRLLVSIDSEDSETKISEVQKGRLLEELEKLAWDRFLNFLTFRERSLWECEKYLQNLPLHFTIAEKLILLATDYNYISDERFTEIMVRSMCEYGKSKREIIGKLKQKRIDDFLINKYLEEYYIPQEQTILAENAKKALARYSQLSQKEQIEKVKNYLFRKGFSYSEIMDVLGRIGEKDIF